MTKNQQMWQILKIAAARGSLLHFPPPRACLMAPVSPIVLLPAAVLLAFLRDGRFARLLAAGNTRYCYIYNAACAPYSRPSVRNISALKAPRTVDGCGGRLILSMCTIFQTASRCPPSLSRRLLYPRGKIARLLHASSKFCEKVSNFCYAGRLKTARTNKSKLIHREWLLELIWLLYSVDDNQNVRYLKNYLT